MVFHEVYKNMGIGIDCLLRKDLHGVGSHEVENTLRRPLEVSQSLVGLAKGGGKYKMAKNGKKNILQL